jgi:ABC-type Fe3+-hydroxamate transport system substrate-binding protein
MIKHNMHLPIILLTALALTGCATTSEQSASEKTSTDQPVIKHDYPTRDRVEYVFNCIAQHGGKLTYIIQYACGCKIDKIAEKLTFEEYETAKTFTLLKSTPGDAGGVFRDPEQSKDLRKKLKEAEAYAEKQCFVK